MASDPELLARFGRKVRQLREARGFSQEALATKCDLDRTYISGIERGKRNLSLQNIQVLAIALGIRIRDLFEEIE